MQIAGFGASTPVGRDGWSSAAAVRAGISGFQQHPYMIDGAGEPLRVAAAPWLDIELAESSRFEALLFPAIEEAMASVEASRGSEMSLALALALPAPRPGLPASLESDLRARLAARFNDRFVEVAITSGGHAGGLLGMRASCRRILQGRVNGCVVAGVESYLSPETLEWLEEKDQLHGAGELNNAWGFVPGEAAGAVLLLDGPSATRAGIEPFARVQSVSAATEHHPMGTREVCVGEGLTAALRGALAALPDGAKVTDIYCDMNGEPYRADEFGFASLRTRERFEAAGDFIAPADCWGDVSAASAPLSAMLSSIAFHKAYACGSYAMLWGSSEGGERAAALLESTDRKGRS